VRRWLHGASAFISSLLGQISLKTKILLFAFGVGLFSTWLLYYFIINEFVGSFVLDWAGRIIPSVLLLLIIASYSNDYFRNRTYRKSHPSASLSPNLKLCKTYQNSTALPTAIGNLGINIGFDNLDNYQGIIITLIGYSAPTQDNNGNIFSSHVFNIEFQPDGTILSTKS
jgi:hypothetical protein